ncbi:hypothetical protein [Paenibacillus piscarius]|uniref:hypothetical protein n=1 Tax=Paenibacillus piscarius TaxID=1089681 RepID=UPI001EE7D00B|nr:hypothetical protein [Paenibacillus piscarius]
MYSNEEKETTAVFDYVSNSWEVYSCVPRHMSKLRKIIAPHWEETTDGKVTAAKFRLSGKQVSFVMGRTSTLTEEQRGAISSRMKGLHQKRNQEVTK